MVAKAGYGSRAHVEDMVRAGRLAVDGIQVLDPGVAVDETSRIQLDGLPLVEAPRRYFACHKSASTAPGTTFDEIMARLAAGGPGLEPVGRLDPRTTGLVLVSNDHWWNSDILSRRRLEREFVVDVQGKFGDAELGIMLGGLHLQGMGYIRPVEARLMERDAAATRLRLVVRGAKIRQVRQIFHSFRHELLALTVTRIGVVRLGDLGPAQARPLTRAEVQGM